MFDMSEIHEAVSRNTKVLMALRGIRNQSELARLAGFDVTALSKKLLGQRPWSLDDVDKLATAFHTQPSAIVGDVAALVDPAKTATGTEVNRTLRGSRGYLPAHPAARIIPFPQVNPAARNLNQDAHVIPLSRAGARSRCQLTQSSTRPSLTINEALTQVSDFLLQSRTIG